MDMKRLALFGLLALAATAATANIPATPVMTLYRFNGDSELPYFELESFARRGATSPAGTLAQGTTLIPCLPVRHGRALTDAKGTPFVGFEIVVDSRSATPEAAARLEEAIAGRKTLTVTNHHCGAGRAARPRCAQSLRDGKAPVLRSARRRRRVVLRPVADPMASCARSTTAPSARRPTSGSCSGDRR